MKENNNMYSNLNNEEDNRISPDLDVENNSTNNPVPKKSKVLRNVIIGVVAVGILFMSPFILIVAFSLTSGAIYKVGSIIDGRNIVISSSEERKEVFKRIVDENNPDMCFSLSQSFTERWDGQSNEELTSSCLVNYASKKSNVEACFGENIDSKIDCILYIARDQDDYRYCDYMKDDRMEITEGNSQYQWRRCVDGTSTEIEDVIEVSEVACSNNFREYAIEDYTNKDNKFLYECLHGGYLDIDFAISFPQGYMLKNDDHLDNEWGNDFTQRKGGGFLLENYKVIGHVYSFEGWSNYSFGQKSSAYKKFEDIFKNGIEVGEQLTLIESNIPAQNSPVSSFKKIDYKTDLTGESIDVYEIETASLNMNGVSLYRRLHRVFKKDNTINVIVADFEWYDYKKDIDVVNGVLNSITDSIWYAPNILDVDLEKVIDTPKKEGGISHTTTTTLDMSSKNTSNTSITTSSESLDNSKNNTNYSWKKFTPQTSNDAICSNFCNAESKCSVNYSNNMYCRKTTTTFGYNEEFPHDTCSGGVIDKEDLSNFYCCCSSI